MTGQGLTRQGRKRRQQLMSEAAKLFAHSGYYATRVIDIVKSAGVAKGLFYWYFENKETLFREIIKAARDDLRRAQAKAIEGEQDPIKRISKGISASLRFNAANEHLYLLFRSAGRQDRFAALIEESQLIHAEDTAAHIAAAIERGQLPAGDPLLLAHGIVATVFQFARLSASGSINMDLDELCEFVEAYCLRALGGFGGVAAPLRTDRGAPEAANPQKSDKGSTSVREAPVLRKRARA